jgi:glycerol-1-phosphatase
VCCDLDGVVWRGEEAVAGAAGGVARLREAGLGVGFLTNNSSQPVAAVVAKLEAMGIAAEPDTVLTSALAAADLLEAELPAGARVFACAGAGVVEALAAAGLEPVDRAPAEAVVVGWHRTFDFDELDRAAALVRDDARFVATNVDATYPVSGGLLPGAGSLVAAVATASGRAPEVAGKPELPTVALVRRRLGDVGVVVGDRPSTDGTLADALGWPFALVLSGVTGRHAPPGGEAVPDPEPPFVADDLAALAPQLVASLASSQERPS